MVRRADGSVRTAEGRDASRSLVALRYLAAALVVAIALGVMDVFRRVPGPDAPFLFAMTPVVFACWLGGLGPGLFAATLVAIGIEFFFIEPLYSFQITSYGVGFNLSVFLLESVGVVWLIEAMRSERRRAERHAHEAEEHERALIQSETRFQQLADSGTIGVVSTDLCGTLLDANDAFLQLIGYSRAELSAGEITWESITPPAHHPRDEQATAELKIRGICSPYEKSYVRKDGSLAPALVGATWPNQFSERIHAYVVDLSARQRAEELAAASARKLADTLENLGDAFVMLDRQWRFTYVNREAERLLHRSNQELFGFDVWRIFELASDAEAHGDAHRELRRAMDENITIHFEQFFPSFNVWYAVHAYPADGGLAVYLHDVSRLKQSEAALRDSERRLRVSRERLDLVLQSSELGLWYCDLPFDTLIWNEKCRELFGVAPEERVTIERFYERLHPDDRHRTREAIEHALAHRQPYDIDYRTLDAAGQVRWIRANGRGFYDESGRAVRFDGVTMDVTQRRAAEEAMRRNEAQLRFAITAAHMGDWSWDLKTGFVVRSASTQRLMGFAAGEMEPHIERFHCCVHPLDQDSVRAAMQRAIEQNVPYEIEFRIVHPDGLARWMYDRGEVFRDEQGQPIQMAGIILDVTDRKQAEVELQRAKEEAEAANRTKDEFLATLSHELRTPLNAILGWAQILQGVNRGGAEELCEGLQVIERNAKAQAQLIEDVLDVSRIISGKMRLDANPIALPPVIEAALATVRPAAAAKEIRLHLALDPAAGPVLGDAGRLQQVVWNLISNAIKFTPRGGRVEVNLARCIGDDAGATYQDTGEHDWVAELTVTDSGQGIKPEFLPHVFERFRQADASTTRKHAGLGLGLAIVRHLVEAHGGTVVAASPGEWQGATFTVRLPIKSPAVVQALAPEPALVHNDSFPHDSQPELSGLRVLVVDDDLDARQLIAKVLRDCRAEVTAVASAAEALASLRLRLPDVLVSDIGMPDQDGYALIRSIRGLEQGAQLPAVALTAFARSEDRARALAAGFQSYMPKPVEPAELASAVAALAGRK